MYDSKVSLQVAQQGLPAMHPQETAHLFNPYVLVNLLYYADRAPDAQLDFDSQNELMGCFDLGRALHLFHLSSYCMILPTPTIAPFQQKSINIALFSCLTVNDWTVNVCI